MVYFDNTTESQRVFIPRTNIEASAYHPSTGGTERYYAGNNIEITPENVINVTGLTEYIENTVTGMTLDYATTGDVETMISAATSDFVTSGDVQSQITASTQNLVTSGDVETMISGFTTTGDVETMITSATSGLASTQYVENAVSGKADTTAVTQSISNSLSSYTPTANFATINGSGITSGGNIVIESGGDSTSIEMITTLPTEPVNGAIYNYNGVLIKYVNGAGNWGEWVGDTGSTNSRKCTPGNGTSFTYAGEIPSSMDGQKLCRSRYFTSSIIDWYLDLSNNRLIGRMSNVDTYTVTKDGSPITAQTGSYSQRVSWVGNKISFANIYAYIGYGGVYPLVDEWCSVATNTAHYELVEPASAAFSELASGYSTTVYVTEDGRIKSLGVPVYSASTRINNGYKTYATIENGNAFPQMIVPETTGATGSLCVASGGYVAPVWKTIAQALGVDFWTGTQTQYDNLGTHSQTTLYFIIPDNS